MVQQVRVIENTNFYCLWIHNLMQQSTTKCGFMSNVSIFSSLPEYAMVMPTTSSHLKFEVIAAKWLTEIIIIVVYIKYIKLWLCHIYDCLYFVIVRLEATCIFCTLSCHKYC
jgi:hypothetical protein